MLFKNQHVKFYSRIVILFLVISTGILYYIANSKRPFPITVTSHKYQPEVLKHSIKEIGKKDSILKLSAGVSEVHVKHNRTKKLEHHDSVTKYGDGADEIKLAVVLCGSRFNQTLVTLKSAVVFSDKPLHFIVIADDENRANFSHKLLEWPSHILQRISFEIHPLHFPNGTEGKEWKKLFKLCACQRLFLPSLLHHIDALLYVDTDVLFLRPVENLWNHFYKMNNSQIAALCPEHEDFATGWYNRFARHPYYAPLGVNSGVMLMNLTKMREFQWESYLPSIMKEYKLHIVWGDQDVINIIFHFHPEKLFIFPCEWNYRPDHCMYTSVCKTAELNGIAAIHGNRGVFHNMKQPAFKAVYRAMDECSFNNYLKSNFFDYLKNYLNEGIGTNCGKHLYSIFSTTQSFAVHSS